MGIVTRFAPSPTGYLHIGGSRTALFNWLLARKTGGKFVLRIEDTDQVRSTEESTRKILEDMHWLGLDWNEGPEVGGPNGPYFQSQRLEIYRAAAQQLLAEGKAYKCFETPDQLAAKRKEKGYKYNPADFAVTPEEQKAYEAEGRPFVVRFRMPEKDITVHDVILGDVTMKYSELEDFVIMKSDGFPTYHFAVVLDDHHMGVTHVLRGQEHLMNTPKHIALQESLGFEHPVYAHMPLIFNMDGSKMSKRDKEKAIKAGKVPPEIDVHDFRVAGYMPEALLNFVALLGWSPGGDRELMTIAEMTELFSVERIGKTNAKFDREKLRAFNTEYIKNADRTRLKAVLKQFLEVTDYPHLKSADDRTLDRILDLYQPRSRTLVEMAENSRFLFVKSEEIQLDPKAREKVLIKHHGYDLLEEFRPVMEQIDSWNAVKIQETMEKFTSEKGIKLADLAQSLRVAISGGMVSPPIDPTLEFLGKEETTKRIDRVLGGR